MKPSELRVGNTYLSTKFKCPVVCEMGDFTEIDKRAEGAKPTEEQVDSVFQPIPLTEEWLIKFGLKDGVFTDIEYYSISRLNSDNELWGLYFENEYTATDVKYVHQLQNLYFALNGEELTLKQ